MNGKKHTEMHLNKNVSFCYLIKKNKIIIIVMDFQ